jgi:hypothetical protein
LFDGSVSCGIYNAQAQQVEFGASVHGPFDQLESMHMSFDRSVAPWLLHGGENSGFVSTEVFDEIGQRAG